MKRAPNRIELTGRTFGKWTVVRQVASRHEKPYWLCRCECGVEREIQGQTLREGRSTSCGCADGKSYEFHASSDDRRYRVWIGMRNRCNNPKATHYARYGGRGIRVCDRWNESYEAFCEDVGDMPTSLHTLDRINNDGHYEPGNVRWATRAEQAKNRHQARVSLANRKRGPDGRLLPD